MQRMRFLAMMTTMVVVSALPALAGGGIFHSGELEDLAPDEAPTDRGWAVASATVTGDRTVVVFNVKGLDRSAAGLMFGAHVQTGPCIAGDGAAAGGHYNAGGEASPETEVWLDFRVTRGGTGHATAVVPFAIAPGTAHSIVIHALPTDPSGAAGARLACIPLEF